MEVTYTDGSVENCDQNYSERKSMLSYSYESKPGHLLDELIPYFFEDDLIIKRPPLINVSVFELLRYGFSVRITQRTTYSKRKARVKITFFDERRDPQLTVKTVPYPLVQNIIEVFELLRGEVIYVGSKNSAIPAQMVKQRETFEDSYRNMMNKGVTLEDTYRNMISDSYAVEMRNKERLIKDLQKQVSHLKESEVHYLDRIQVKDESLEFMQSLIDDYESVDDVDILRKMNDRTFERIGKKMMARYKMNKQPDPTLPSAQIINIDDFMKTMNLKDVKYG
jgi:hypothetical protein